MAHRRPCRRRFLQNLNALVGFDLGKRVCLLLIGNYSFQTRWKRPDGCGGFNRLIHVLPRPSPLLPALWAASVLHLAVGILEVPKLQSQAPRWTMTGLSRRRRIYRVIYTENISGHLYGEYIGSSITFQSIALWPIPCGLLSGISLLLNDTGRERRQEVSNPFLLSTRQNR